MGFSEYEYQQLLDNQRAAAGKPPRIRGKSAADISEAKLEQIGTQILIHDGWRALKTDPVSDRRRGKGFGELGMADYLYIRYAPIAGCAPSWNGRGRAEVLWCEWKRPDGVVADHQRRWHAEERARGAWVVVATEDFEATPEGFAEWYRKSGLQRSQ